MQVSTQSSENPSPPNNFARQLPTPRGLFSASVAASPVSTNLITLGGYQLQACRKSTTTLRVGMAYHMNSRKVNGYKTTGQILLIQLQMTWMKAITMGLCLEF